MKKSKLDEKHTEFLACLTDQAQVGELEQLRDGDVGQIVVDVVRRDTEEGRYNIDAIFYVMPGVDQERAMRAVQAACVDVFGPRPEANIELFFQPPSVGVEVMGSPLQCASYTVTIKHPSSMFYQLDGLQMRLLKALARLLGR